MAAQLSVPFVSVKIFISDMPLLDRHCDTLSLYCPSLLLESLLLSMGDSPPSERSPHPVLELPIALSLRKST
ncbi:uncharacterized protein PHALS_04548 [Plasmopara halstedii]|uniref:Uncharacterized protein n=1 Tax=Plasmopara halstedii TaxID=4781 RepID=A0A0P1A9F8_PLAHL|nr:uncharacterized protein PHALS_04548 [Plasmopara halstedii]CEG37088.1 hypothetical protein PHALS_04548 [Plasmopara halstedii]|eukprot:XP_024573457.1 hypothetical protein PHALS_04548 [Plasmopara halstedii]